MFNYIYSVGGNIDFDHLCNLLDDYLNDVVGGVEKRAEYVTHNNTDDINDIIIAYDDGNPFACVSFKHIETGTAEVKRVFVKEEYRGMGISKELMKHLEDKAHAKGYSTLLLETGRILTSATKLYKGLGYTEIPSYGPYVDFPDSICMMKRIK